MLKGSIILVTGSNEGIGYAIAKLCHEKGAHVVLHGIKASTLEASAAKLGKDVSYIAADLSEPDAPNRIIDFVMARYGRIDGLVNNAGLLDRCTLDTVTGDLIERMFAINVGASVMLIKAVVAHMEKQSTGGSIVNIGSVNASCGAPTLLIYSATKGAMETITRNLGAALGPKHIRINQINVGWTVTENENRIQAAEGQPENWHDLVQKDFKPSGALLSPSQVAEHAVFWLSDASSPVTGQVCDVEQYPMIGRAFGANWSEK